MASTRHPIRVIIRSASLRRCLEDRPYRQSRRDRLPHHSHFASDRRCASVAVYSAMPTSVQPACFATADEAVRLGPAPAVTTAISNMDAVVAACGCDGRRKPCIRATAFCPRMSPSPSACAKPPRHRLHRAVARHAESVRPQTHRARLGFGEPAYRWLAGTGSPRRPGDDARCCSKAEAIGYPGHAEKRRLVGAASACLCLRRRCRLIWQTAVRTCRANGSRRAISAMHGVYPRTFRRPDAQACRSADLRGRQVAA